jgi:membrane protein
VGSGPVVALRGVLDRYDAAGGALLAGGLAYNALFAIVPLTILVAGIVGLVMVDPADQAGAVDVIADALPPLRDLVRLVLGEAAAAAGTISVLGGLALLWGASRFVVAFEAAMGRIFGGTRRRGLVVRNLAGIAAVLALLAAAVIGAILTGLSSILAGPDIARQPILRAVNGPLLAVLPIALAVVSVAVIYRLVPVAAPTWRAIVPPAIVVALALGALARIFAFLAPRLIGAAAAIGTVATAFAALAWLGISFQAILLGAAWTRQRDASWGILSPALDSPESPDPSQEAESPAD